MRFIAVPLLATALTLAACGGSDSADDASPVSDTAEQATDADATDPATDPADPAGTGLVTVAPEEVAALLADAPDDVVILDVRTPEEFTEARIDGATVLDFYESDFREQLGELDRDTPYVLYCRSGNRSGQTLQMMRELGFTSVTESSGGILAWADAGLPLVSG